MHMLVSGNTSTVTLTALNAFGQQVTNGFPAPGDVFTLVDNTTANYPITAETWNDGVGTLEVTAPTITINSVNRTLILKLNGSVVNVNPDPLLVTIFPPYNGKFVLTNAVIAWDCSVAGSNLTSRLYDYSGNNRYAVTQDLGYFYYWAYSNLNYKTSSIATPINLGHCATVAISNQTIDTTAILSADAVTALPSFTPSTLPIRTIQTIVWRRDAAYTNETPVTLFYLKFEELDNPSWFADIHCEFLWDGADESIAFSIDGSTTILEKFSLTGNFDFAQAIVSVACIINSDYTIDVYFNNDFMGTVAAFMVDPPTDLVLAQYSGIGSISIVPPITNYGFAQFELVAYSDIKNAAFIETNVNAWGLE